VRCIGEASVSVLRRELGAARFGLVDYDADRLAKSTIFAAYCAHGVIPICLSDRAGEEDGLHPGSNYLKLTLEVDLRSIAADHLDALQAAAVRWYDDHSLRASCAIIAGLIDGDCTKADLS
jgi:hypothetical protein